MSRIQRRCFSRGWSNSGGLLAGSVRTVSAAPSDGWAPYKYAGKIMTLPIDKSRLIWQVAVDTFDTLSIDLAAVYNAVNISQNHCLLQPHISELSQPDRVRFVQAISYSTVPQVFTSDQLGQLSLAEIEELRLNSVSMVGLSFHEVLSAFSPFPTEYVQQVLSYARLHGLFVFWNEWNINTYPTIQSLIQGYEDIVTVSFGTNANYVEPEVAFPLTKSSFGKWGASIQSWYYWERHPNATSYDCPVDTLRTFTCEADILGANYIQFEPYWYFFKSIPHSPA